MAEDLKHDQGTIKIEEDVAAPAPVEATDRGLFGLRGKKEGEKKPQEGAIATEFEQKVHVSKPVHKEEEKKHGSLLEKLHRSDSSSSSSSEEEVEEDGKKIRKKKERKGLKEKIKEKISGTKKEEDHETHVPVEKCEEPVHAGAGHEAEEKKGFLDKIKEKLPGGGQKKPEEVPPPPPPPPAAECTSPDAEAKEKKGFLEKIKEKLPGYHHKTEEEKEKEAASH